MEGIDTKVHTGLSRGGAGRPVVHQQGGAGLHGKGGTLCHTLCAGIAYGKRCSRIIEVLIDLGKDVEPSTIVQTVKEQNIRLVGLSALMTTTVHNMEETIAVLRRECPSCKIMVGGAVLTAQLAEKIGADYYAKDAAGSAKIAAEVEADI